MDKKTAIVITAILIALLAVVALRQNAQDSAKQELLQKFQLIKSQYDAAKASGYDVSEAERLGTAAKQAFDKGNYNEANRLLGGALAALEKATTPADNYPPPTIAPQNTSFTPPNKNWIYDGAVFMEDFRPLRTFNDLVEMVPQLKDIGVKTIEMFGLWDHDNSQLPGYRWATRDFSKLDPARGDENEFKSFVDAAHDEGLKIIPLVVSTVSASPDSRCAGKTILNTQYDKEGQGGALYKYWQEDPNRDVFLKNNAGNFSCDYAGYGFITNLGSADVLAFFKNFYNAQITGRNLDGMRMDTPNIHSCKKGEVLYAIGTCQPQVCIDPSTETQNTLAFYKNMLQYKLPNHVFISETYLSRTRFSDWFCKYPYYPPNTDLDEVASVSEGYEFEYLLGNNILKNPLTSQQFVDWVNNQPGTWQRFRMIRNVNGIDEPIIRFVDSDKRYYPAATLAVTVPGVPKVTDFELFGNSEYDNEYKITPANLPNNRLEHWKKILNIRNINKALKYGDIKNIWKSGDNVYTYSRTYENETAIVVINFHDKTAISVLNLPFKSGIILYDEFNNENFTVSDPSGFKVSVPAYGSRILLIKR